MVNWTNNTEMLFLELYHSENILWDDKNPHHKNKIKIHDAWMRISVQMCIDVKELKKKKDSLLSSYRLYRKKVRDSIHSGAGAEEIYKPIWFAYAYMDTFLGEGLSIRKTTDTLSQESDQENIDPAPMSDENPATTKRRRKNPPELQEAGSFIKESLANLNQVLCRNNKEDDCDRYGKILANKLKQLPEDERLIFMHQIDGMFIERRRSLSQNLLSPPVFILSSSPSPNIVQSPQSQAGSSFTSYSDHMSVHRTNDPSHISKMAQSEPIINNKSNTMQYPPVIHIPEQTNKRRIRILSNKIVSRSPSTQTESFSQPQHEYEYNIISDAYDNS